ncbi:MAG TPA: serine/threonine-protein kinase [Gemmatimonadaceae bacterium]
MTQRAGDLDALFVAFQEAVVGRYSLQRELGRGGMGVVYLARELRLDRPVAIKLLPPELAAQARLRDRFTREARTAARLSHPYIVPIHAVDEASGFVFYVMAYVDGETLAQRVMSRGPLPPAEATRVLREVAWALAYAHMQGVIHRDVKPANILLERGTGRAMVTDFGIARLAQASGETTVGELLGTPEYMSPEQASGEPVDARSDIYSLGVVAYYAVSGTLPLTGPTAQAVLAKQITQLAPPVASVARGTPRSLAVAIDTCMHKDPAQRIQSGEALADALAPALDKRAEVPVPIRNFLDPRKMWTLALYPAVSIAMASVVIGVDVQRVLRLDPRLVVAFLATALVGSVVMPIALVTKWLRPLLRLGYGPTDVASGLRTTFDRKREEYVFEHGAAPSERERALNVVTIATVAVNVGSWAAMGLGASFDWLPALAFISGGLWPLAGLFGASTARMRTGAGSWWAKRWDGKLGRWLTKLASINLGARAAAADRPTEMAIAFSAQALFEELPKDLRRSLGDVPVVLQELESQARVVRARIEQLDATITETHTGIGSGRADTRGKQDALIADLREARVRAEERLANLLTALETTRLDLLRLRAGHGSAESITQNLLAAKTLGEDVDRLLSGRAEVDAALRGRETTPI